MLTTIKKLFFLFFPILLIGLFCANLAVAQCTCPGNAVCLCNPLTAKDFPSLINAIINFLFVVVLALGGVMIVIAGFYFVTAAGDPQKISAAKKIILYTLIGIAVVIFSKGIMSIIRLVLGVQ